MFIPGRYNLLPALRKADHGWYLGDELKQVLLPNKYAPADLKEGDRIRVFLYFDSEDRLIATNLEPLIQRDSFALLKAKDTGPGGAYFDWGLAKDLLVPYREQQKPVQPGESHVVYLYFDDASGRLVGSTKIRKFLRPADEDIHEGDQVDLLLYDETELGWSAIVNDHYAGLLFKNRAFGNVRTGDRVKGYVRVIREDGKIDLSMSREGYARISGEAGHLMELLRKNQGSLTLTDKSSPDDISRMTGMSKKAFKMAVGALYKQRLIQLTDTGIHLITED